MIERRGRKQRSSPKTLDGEVEDTTSRDDLLGDDVDPEASAGADGESEDSVEEDSGSRSQVRSGFSCDSERFVCACVHYSGCKHVTFRVFDLSWR